MNETAVYGGVESADKAKGGLWPRQVVRGDIFERMLPFACLS